jgi:carbon monoxide dehydrogenase subunit G
VKVQGTREFAVPREQVWEVLNDPARMAKTMPGVESFDVEDDRHWKANVKIPLGLGGLRMSINFEKTDEREPEYSRLHAKGTGVGAIMSMDTQFNLADEGARTKMDWEADVRIAGPVGSMGQRVLQPIVNQQISQVLAALEREVQAAAGEPSASSSEGGGTAGAPEPSTEAPAERNPELKGYGPPAEAGREGEPDQGASGAEEGISPWHEESYTEEPEGPTTSTDDTR